ncbi:hypothetical protein JCM3766R1_006643 [Sporobolomyces carnicolor]
MTSKILYLTRHAQAEHNVAEDYSIPDAPLTKLGREQSAQLRKDTEGTWTKNVDLLVSSPLKRPMQTFIIGYAPLRERLEKDNKPVVLLPELQEVNALPCDTGSSRKILEADPEFQGLDFSNLDSAPARHDGNDWTSKKGFFSPEQVGERAKWVRNWLRDRQEERIVVVAHGDILRCLTEGRQTATPWANAEVRAYRFKSDDDDEAELVKVQDLEEEGRKEPTSTQMRN